MHERKIPDHDGSPIDTIIRRVVALQELHEREQELYNEYETRLSMLGRHARDAAHADWWECAGEIIKAQDTLMAYIRDNPIGAEPELPPVAVHMANAEMVGAGMRDYRELWEAKK